MVSILGLDLDGAFGEIRSMTGDLLDNVSGSLGRGDAPRHILGGGFADPFGGMRYGGGVADPFAGLNYGGKADLGFFGGGMGTDYGPTAAQENLFDIAGRTRYDKAAKADTEARAKAAAATAIGSQVGGGPSAGMSPGVAKWAAQAQQTFGGLVDPDVMLAIMQNESGGDPNAYNKAGDAWGLFQQLHLGSNDPNVQFQAARKLAEEKVAGINAAYAKNGLNPDERTRALDFALAWAGHFDYGTGRMDPSSVDNLVGGQTSQQFADIFLGNYDKIKAGRAAGGAGTVQGGSGMLAGAWAFPVVGYQGQIGTHWGTDELGASDIMAAAGTPIVAMHGGRVTDASYNNYGGNTVTIVDDQGRTYYYAHMQGPAAVAAGQTVAAGAALGAVGNTGDAAGGPTHLHIGISAPGTNIKLGKDAHGGAGWNWGTGPQDNAVGLLRWILSGGGTTGGGGASYR
jgi:murein DD-endopeptidase MepM/ murein hydrolase activator NlpD